MPKCKRAKSAMTPCYIKDGDLAVAEAMPCSGARIRRVCVGCERTIKSLREEREEAAGLSQSPTNAGETAMPEYQPMETAPRTGRDIILLMPDGTERLAGYLDCQWCGADDCWRDEKENDIELNEPRGWRECNNFAENNLG